MGGRRSGQSWVLLVHRWARPWGNHRGVGSALCIFAPPPHRQVTCNPMAWRSPLLVFPGHSRVDTAVPDCLCAAWDVLGSVLGAHLALC